jgi:hypothetical protein
MRNETIPIYHRTSETSSPTANDDATSALSVGSELFNKNSGRWYKCNDNTEGGAQWVGLATLDDIPDTNRSYGEMYISSPANTTSVSSSSYKKASGTTAGGALNDFTHSTNRLTYTGATTKHFRVSVDGKIVGGVAATITVGVYKNGDTLVRAEDTTTIVLVSEGSYGINCLVELATNEYVELFVKATTGTVQLKTSTLTITEI